MSRGAVAMRDPAPATPPATALCHGGYEGLWGVAVVVMWCWYDELVQFGFAITTTGQDNKKGNQKNNYLENEQQGFLI